MEIRLSEEDGIAVVRLCGRFDELAAREAEQVFHDLLDRAVHRVLVDLSGVDYVSSSALRVLLLLHRGLTRLGGVMKVCALTPFVAEVLETSNLSRVFDVFGSREAAVKSFGLPA